MKRSIIGKLLACMLIAAMAVCMLTACGGSEKKAEEPKEEKVEKKDLIVFAAASMTETLDQLKADYENDHPEGNPKNIKSFDDMKAGLTDGSIKMAMGNADVPVGQYTQKILTYYGLNEKELAGKGVITYGTNVKEVTTQVTEGTVDCGIIYETDAYSAKLKPVATATEEMCGKTIYPIAILKKAPNKDGAQAFIDYLCEDHAKEVFEKVGFIPLT